MERQRFERLAAEAVDSLPKQFREKMDNVAIVVQYWPTGRQLAGVGLRRRDQLLGLYEGVPLTIFGKNHSVMPDKITIFQRPIELAYRGDRRIVEGIEKTVRHEIAHHFGLSDARIYDISRRRRRSEETEGEDGG
ncbi:MAG: metallopeptidase family protein [Chloroflexota bacterium]|nr:metallopeptidase family protein [Chloroflexota bacterium]